MLIEANLEIYFWHLKEASLANEVLIYIPIQNYF